MLFWWHDKKPQTKLNKLIIFVHEIAQFAARCLAASGFKQTRRCTKKKKGNLNLHAPATTLKSNSAWRSLALHSIIPPESTINLVFYYLETKKAKESRSPRREKAFRRCYNKPFCLGFIDQSLWANVIILINRGTAGRIIMRLTLINDQPNAALFSQGPPPLTRSHGPAACAT